MPYVRATPPARPESRRRFRRALAAATVVVALSSLLAVSGSAEPAAALTGHVQGTVFRDYDTDGVYDTTASAGVTDVPLKGVTATVYNGAGAAVGSAVTTVTGTYDITVALALPDNTPLRIEFTGYPAGYTDSFHGSGSFTSVQFTRVGATGVNLALHKPTDLAKGTNTPIVTAIQANGAYNGANSAAKALTAIRRTTAVNTAASTATTTLATFGDVGAVWGVATQSISATQSYVYVAAVTKRHSGWGPQGVAGLYRVLVTISATGATTAGAITPYNLSGAGRPSYGTIAREFTDQVAGGAIDSVDQAAFAAAGKVGIGGIAYADGRLYVVNLADSKIWSYNVNNFAAAPTEIVVTGITSTERPWALATHQGRLYVGLTDTANVATGARILSRPLATATWTLELTIPLDYARGISWAYDSTAQPSSTGQTQALWHPWTDDYATLWTTAMVPGQTWGFRSWAQPILSGLTFDDGGNLVLGLADRFSLQGGVSNLWPDWTTTNNRTGATILPVGDVLYAGRNAAGQFVLENTGTATNGTVAVTTPGNDNVTRTPGYGNAAAAGQTRRQAIQHKGREFFEDSVRWDGAGGIDPAEGVVHDETGLGAVAIIPGLSEVVSTSFDAAQNYNNAGNRFLSLIDGHSIDGFDQYAGAAAYFAKAGGIGGVAALLTDAPVEIGNRVWYDADADGIQDADEPAINDAPVQLWTADSGGNRTGTVPIATATTATVDGQPGSYFFRTSDAGGPATFVKNANYVVVFPSASATTPVDLQWPTGMTAPAWASGLTWAQLTRTSAAVGGNRLIDSNPNATTGDAPVYVGDFGEDDHSIDAGWVGLRTFSITKTIVGTAPVGASYTFSVASAVNFRGEDRRWTSGAASAPIVDTLSYTLTADQTLTSTETIPYGYTLTFTEDGANSAMVAFSPNTGGANDDTGRLVVTSDAAAVTATNSYGSITVTKALAPDATLPPGTTFPVEYSIDGAAAQTVQVAPGAPVTIASVPYGSSVKLREPLTGPFSWGGFTWTSGTWTQGATTLVPDASGWITAPTNATSLALTLTNHPYLPPTLPFTGGLGADVFTIGGAVVLALALGLGVWQFHTRRRRLRPRRP